MDHITSKLRTSRAEELAIGFMFTVRRENSHFKDPVFRLMAVECLSSGLNHCFKLVLRKIGRLVLFIDGDTIVFCLHFNSVIISNYLFKYFYCQMFIFA